jgi:hypothetical protein
MEAATVEFRLDHERHESVEVLRTKPTEPLDELVERGIGIALDMREAIERLERPRGAVAQDPLRARDPVVQLGADEMTDDIVRSPAVRDNARSRSGVRRRRSVVSCRKSFTAERF